MCNVELESKDTPGHVHTCASQHEPGSGHICADRTCRRWYGLRGEVV